MERTEIDISTHTLTWSVTSQVKAVNLDKQISTHTLTWSVTGALDKQSCGKI